MSRWHSGLAVGLLLVLAGCNEPPVTSVEFDPTASFDGLKSYRWMPDSGRITADRPLAEPEVRDRVVQAVDAALAARGFLLAANGHPDFLVGYHLGLKGRPDIRSMNAYYNYPPGWAWDYYRPGRDLSPREAEQPALVLEDLGAVVVDIARATDERLVWRGTIYSRVPKVRRDASDLDQAWFNERAQELVAKFPPAP